MINKIIETCLRNRFIVVIAFVGLVIAGIFSMKNIPVDAIPDIGELQVLVYADWPGRSPQDIEDQVIYPLSTGLMGTPGVKVVRSSSAFGFGLVNMIFKEGTDFYWARTRVLERLDLAKKGLPSDVTVTLGPDATAVGQIFWYTVENGRYKDGNGVEQVSKLSLAELRSIQDWYVRYQLASVPGVAEVAGVGGYVKEYQIDIDPNALVQYNIKLPQLLSAVKKSNLDVGAKVFEEGAVEYVVRGLGFIKSEEDIENIVVTSNEGVPIYVKNLGNVTTGAQFRRSVLDKEGIEVTGGVVVMRFGEKPLEVIEAIKAKVEELSLGLPKGVKIVPFYDRTGLILRAINTLKNALTQEILITIFIILIFLLHFAGSMIIAMVLPVGILISFLLMSYFGVDANIMSLGGIAIAIGVMVDSGCVLVENVYRRIVERRQEQQVESLSKEERLEETIKASQEVGRPVLFGLLTTIVGFMPVFVLTGQAGKLFRPLAYTKTFAMFAAALIALTLLPTLCLFLLKGKLVLPEKNKAAKILNKFFQPSIRWALSNAKKVIIIAVCILLIGLISGASMKQEFMPPINEGDLLFMPVLMPGASLTQVQEVMRKQNIIIKKEFSDQVDWVVGKLGRAETATDPAPVIMIETIIHLKERDWTAKEREKLIADIQQKTKIPGVSPIMTQPIRNRIDMLATGIQTPVGVKVFGEDLATILKIGQQIEAVVADVKGAVSPYAERSGSRPYFEIDIDRQECARYGVMISDVQQVIMTAIGGMSLTTAIEGRERYAVRVRYKRELRDSVDALKNVIISSPNGPIPLVQLAKLEKKPGPAVISAENTMNYIRVFINVDQSKQGLIDFVKSAQKAVNDRIESGDIVLPAGYYISWSGQFESEMESRKTLIPSVVICLGVILLLLYFAFSSGKILLILATGIPVSLMGGIIFLNILGLRFSTAVWIGFIALFGVATDNAVVLLACLEDLFKKKKPQSKQELYNLVIEGTSMRLMPIIMTTMTTIIALLPVILSTGAGSEVMRPMAAPTVGGLITATLSNLFLVPVIYFNLRIKKKF